MKFVFCSSVEREVFGSLGTHLSIPSVVTRVTYGDTASRNGPLRIARNPTFFFLPSFSDNGKHCRAAIELLRRESSLDRGEGGVSSRLSLTHSLGRH